MPVQRPIAQVATKFRRLLLICGAAALALPSVAGAATVEYNLADLLAGGSTAGGFTIGDKRYSNFTFSSTGDVELAPDDVNVRVTSIDSNPTIAGDDQYTLQFTFGLDAFPGETNDLVIGYQVDVTDPAMFINQVGLRFNGTVPAQGTGDAAASVVETVRSPNQSFDLVPGGDPNAPDRYMAVLGVTNDGPGRETDSNSQFIAVNPTRTLIFEKDILVSSRPDGGYPVISVVDNVINQVPEPTALGLAAFAGAGLLLRRRRR
jgi:hypothetical protein